MDYSKQFATWWLGTCYHKEQLDEMLSSTEIRGYAYILHDKDTDPKTQELKKPHYHFLLQLTRNQRGSWFSRFATDDMGQLFPKPCFAPQGAYDYLIHDTNIARKEGKHLYDVSERFSTLDSLESEEEKEESKKADTAKLRKLILEENKAPSEIVLDYNLNPQQINLIDRLYSEHMNKPLKESLRANIKAVYLFGKPRTGKTSFVYKTHKPNEFYRVTNYKNPFDNYAYQKILVLDEYDSQLDIEYINNLLDLYPCELSCRFFNKWAAWEKVYVISNLPLSEQYKMQAIEKRKAFQSRFHEIKCFDPKEEKGLTPLTKAESEQLPF